jgi:hypothetical protein
MKAKEKAAELFRAFLHIRGYSAPTLKKEVLPNDNSTDPMQAKKCALIAVDEIISQLAIINNNESFNISKYGNYWQEVKEELKKL